MKRFCLLLILIAFCFQLSAQEDYRPFVVEGKSWKYYIKATTSWWDGKEAHWDTEYAYSTLTIKGDTVVNGKEYKKVMHSSDKAFFYEVPEFIYGIIREEDRKVYMRFNYPDIYDSNEIEYFEEYLIYDFNLKVGDSFTVNYGVNDLNLKLISIEETDGKRIYSFTTNSEYIPTMQWMEGAGGPYGLCMEQRTDVPTCIFCTRYTFLSLTCSLGDEVLCSFDDEGNVVLGVEEVKADVNKDKSVYDLQGRRLNVEPSHGIYIKDGKKVAR